MKKEGFAITQATLSRDMKQLKVAKAATTSGKYIYVLPNEIMYRRVSTQQKLNEMLAIHGLLSIDMSGNVAVMRTRPGYAGSIGYDIDVANIPQILGTVCGDDTVFLVVREGVSLEELKEHLRKVFPEYDQR